MGGPTAESCSSANPLLRRELLEGAKNPVLKTKKKPSKNSEPVNLEKRFYCGENDRICCYMFDTEKFPDDPLCSQNYAIRFLEKITTKPNTVDLQSVTYTNELNFPYWHIDALAQQLTTVMNALARSFFTDESFAVGKRLVVNCRDMNKYFVIRKTDGTCQFVHENKTKSIYDVITIKEIGGFLEMLKLLDLNFNDFIDTLICN